MKISVLLNAHDNPEIVADTLESILTYVSNDVLLLVDGKSWNQFEHLDFGVPKMEGFVHGVPRSPYRNVALGLKYLTDQYDSDWYCTCEYDVLFASDRFKMNLREADKRNVWMLGNDGHIEDYRIPLVESMIGSPFRKPYYLLGCCQFFSRKFIDKLKEMDFFDNFLYATNSFESGYMPGYGGYDVSESLYPSLARQYGGNIGVFASYDAKGTWHGAYQYFPMRWTPQIDPETENFPEASIIHPLKEFEHPIREYHRQKRHGN